MPLLNPPAAGAEAPASSPLGAPPPAQEDVRVSVPGENWPCDVPVGVWEPEPPPLPPSRGSFIGVLIVRVFVSFLLFFFCFFFAPEKSTSDRHFEQGRTVEIFFVLDPITFLSFLSRHAFSRARSFPFFSRHQEIQIHVLFFFFRVYPASSEREREAP